MKYVLVMTLFVVTLLACDSSDLSLRDLTPAPTLTIVLAEFSTPTLTPVMIEATPIPRKSATPRPLSTTTATSTSEPSQTPTTTPTVEPTLTLELSPTFTPASLASTPTPEPPPAPAVDFVLRYVRLRTNEENSWDGTLGPGNCGSDHSIYVHVADAQENLLDGVLIGDKFGNFEVPTGVDGPGAVRILVWSATMELAVIGHQDGTRYTSQFTPPLSTLDEDIPLEWLQQAGFCESPDDCRWRVDNNQLCRGHYSYDVIFQRTW
jgi:hypothetical protein